MRKKMAAEKKNSESWLPTRIMRYTEMHQRINKKKKDKRLQAASALFGGTTSKKVLCNILPPSNPSIGKRFKSASAADADGNAAPLFTPAARQIGMEIRLASGPAAHKRISLP